MNYVYNRIVWFKNSNIILYFRVHIFMSLIVLYFLQSTAVLSFYIDVVLTLSMETGLH